MSDTRSDATPMEAVAGNGLLHRRVFLAKGGTILGAGALGLMTPLPAPGQSPPEIPRWTKSPGAGMSGYSSRSEYEDAIHRTIISAPGTTGSGASRTPLEALEGMITPSALHFERHHSGVPDIDPDTHRLLIHGMVERPLTFTMDALSNAMLM